MLVVKILHFQTFNLSKHCLFEEKICEDLVQCKISYIYIYIYIIHFSSKNIRALDFMCTCIKPEIPLSTTLLN